jgi:hypothetical protein
MSFPPRLDQIERANAVLASTPLSARPIGRHNREGADEVTDLRFIVLHMIEERHGTPVTWT